MFTGIIEEVGALAGMRKLSAGARLTIRCRTVLSDITIGASMAVNGVCLTAVEFTQDSFCADVSPETLERSNLGDMRTGAPVNLERPLSPSGRLGGHLVQGHVDGTGEFSAALPAGDGNYWISVRVPEEVDRYIVDKGSITFDGISLTVAKLESGVVTVAVIPHTYANTTLGALKRGDRVNIECDVLAKYVEKLLAPRKAEGLTMDKLRNLGF